MARAAVDRTAKNNCMGCRLNTPRLATSPMVTITSDEMNMVTEPRKDFESQGKEILDESGAVLPTSPAAASAKASKANAIMNISL